MASNSQQSWRALIINSVANLDTMSHAIFPKCIRQCWKLAEKEDSGSSYSLERNGYVIPDEYTFLENGETFLLFDDGEHDVDRILVFGTESGRDDLEKYRG